MSVESVYTAHSAQNSTTAKATGKAGAASAGGVSGALASGNFFDLFLANISAANKEKSEDMLENNASLNGGLSGDGELDIAALIAEDAQAAEDLAAGDITQALSLNARIFDNILRPMGDEHSQLARSDAHAQEQAAAVDALLARLNGQDENEQHDLMAVLNGLFDSNKHTSADGGLSTDKKEGSSDVIGLLALNMTPQELSDLKDNLDNIAEEIQNFATANTRGGVHETALIAQANTSSKTHETALGAQANTSALAAHAGENIAALDTRYANGKKADARFTPSAGDDASAQNNGDNNARGEKALGETERLNAQNNAAKNGNGGGDTGKTNTPDFLTIMNDINTGLNAGLDGTLQQMAPAAPNSLQALSSNLTHSAHASEAHPATQMVAMQVQKSANDGRNKIFTIQLDPPDLGKVDVRMEFGSKDKTMKTVLTIEKPETYAMLQRDVHALERALQDMGLDLESGIGFELADQGSDFMGDNRRGGGHDHGGANGAGGDIDAGEDDIIETSLMWMVDPDTGHTRYDFWA